MRVHPGPHDETTPLCPEVCVIRHVEDKRPAAASIVFRLGLLRKRRFGVRFVVLPPTGAPTTGGPTTRSSTTGGENFLNPRQFTFAQPARELQTAFAGGVVSIAATQSHEPGCFTYPVGAPLT
jgi:hypothetical protein